LNWHIRGLNYGSVRMFVFVHSCGGGEMLSYVLVRMD
jgi:hypothetical protein